MVQASQGVGGSGRGPGSERLARKHQQALYGDYFQVLEVARDADPITLARAVTALVEEFDPALAASVPEPDRPKLRLVAAVVREAALVLGDPELRICYREHLPPGR